MKVAPYCTHRGEQERPNKEDSEMNAKTNPVEKLESKSTLYQKLSPDERRKLNRAVVDRAQPTYRTAPDDIFGGHMTP